MVHNSLYFNMTYGKVWYHDIHHAAGSTYVNGLLTHSILKLHGNLHKVKQNSV